MKIFPADFVLKTFSVLLLTVLILGTPGMGVQRALALTTSVDETTAGNIPDTSCGSSITRTFTVSGVLSVADVNVGLNISHNRRSDVRVTLTSPSGTTVELISGNGLGNPVASPDDYNNYDVLLDDSSINSLYDNDNDDVGGALFDRNAKPSGALTAFVGENGTGTWTLTICDRRSGEIGIYNQSRLILTTADPNTVSGTVFTDYNDNGFREQGDAGVPNVTVTAYNAAGVVAATTTTDVNGNYTFSGITNGTPLRIEFSNIPADLRPGAFGENSGTTVQFVTSPQAGVDMGLAKPDEYCQANPFIVSPCYKNGDPLAPGNNVAGETVLLSVPYDAYGRQDDGIENSLANAAQIGATWGLGFQRSTGRLFAGALAKRHTGLGPNGTGAIYSLILNPNTGTGTAPSLFLDLAAFGIPTDTAPALGSNSARGLSTISSQPSFDPTGWDAVGKDAIGDIDMGSDDTKLWVMNLANQTLYRIDVGSPATPPTSINDFEAFPVVLPGNATSCATSDVRPWAVEINQGFVYVGVVCSAESTQNVNDLRAYILRIPEGAAVGTNYTLVTEFALNYDRGFVTNPGVYVGNTQPGFPAEWRPWSPVMTSLCHSPCAGVTELAFGKQIIYPQPILSDIEFDTNGDLILGFMDRIGHQTGNQNQATSSPWVATLYNFQTGYSQVPNVTVTPGAELFEGVSAGDTIRMCSNGAGGFVLESNASCGGITTGGSNSNPAQGPNGGEYYWQDMFVDPTSIGATGLGATTDPNAGTHHEITLGGLLLIPGTNEIAVSIFDPFDIRAGGIAWFNNLTGTRSRAYEVFNRDAGGGATTFGKAAGLGDIEGFCMNAPIEIGNRVWFDTDNDGIQDADETPIPGVTVELYDQNGNLLATAVTDANGNYYFSSGPGTNTTSQIYNIANFGPNSQFEVRIPLGQPALAGLTLTTNDANANNEDQRDSDGQDNNAGAAAVVVQTLGPGNNNHTYDFGFTATYSLGNRVWLDDGTGGGGADNGIQDGTEVGIANVVVNLYRDTNNDGIPDGGVIDTVNTDANGYYRFDNLTAGGYVVEIPASNFNAGNPLFSLGSSTPDETNPNADVDVNDNGIGVVPDVINGIRSGSVTLGPGTTEPVTEPDVPTTGPFAGQGAPDNRANMTVDFGFVPSYSIGNRVWFDTDNDSTRDAGTEVGVDGVVVELYSVDALGNFTLVATTTTANGGYYRFDGLPAGDYVVVIPEDNFTDDGTNDALVGYWSSGTTINNSGVTGETAAPDADNDLDDDDNGTLQNAGAFPGAVISSVVTLGPGTVEPLNEADLSPTGQGAIDSRANMTVDFGFYRLELGDLVFEDVNNNGTFDGTDAPIPGITVQLFSENGTEINVGPDGILGTPDDAPGGMLTDGNGLYLFGGLPQGNYIVRVLGPAGYTSTIDTFDSADNANPNANTNNNDNGIGTGAGVVSSAVVTLTPGSTGAANNNTVNQNTGTTRNPTVDFGFVQPDAEIIKSVTPAQATIGELVTYTLQIQVPPGTFNGAQVVDTMEQGLALFDCQSITGVGVATSLAGGFGCAGNVTTAPGTGVDIDRIVTFTLGDLTNTGQVDGTITIIYRAMVLDVVSNRGGATQTQLDNSAQLTWNNTPLPPVSRTITVIEPDLQIVKSSNTNFVAVGTDVEFTLTVTHTANSRSDAFDVVITDVIPNELDYVANSIDCDDGDQDAALVSCTYNAGTRTISAEWNTFTRLPAGDELIIRFRVTGNALLGPGQTITNVGNVEWTSELGDQTAPASFSNPPNPFATERFYDPASPNPINTIYGDTDSLVLNPVGGGGGGGGGTSPVAFTSGFLIANTGFEASVVTPLDVATRPDYAATGLTLTIPGIKVDSSIAGVKLKDGNWDVSWLVDQAGWLEGTAYPTWSGNSVLTAHVVNADGKPGLFSRLKFVKVGDYVFVYNGGYRYTYQVISNQSVQPDDIRVLNHEEKPHLTLITCDRFDFETKTYLRRVVVRAVLVDVSAVK